MVGIKDSSGGCRQPRRTRRGARREDRGRCWSATIVLLRNGLRRGWDGGISGVAGFCPELARRDLSELRQQGIWTRPRGFRACSTS